MKKAMLHTKVSVKLRKSELRDEWYLYLEAYPVFKPGHDKPCRKREYLNRIITTPMWDKTRPARIDKDVVQTKPEVSPIFRKTLLVDDKHYSIAMPLEAYTAMKDAIEVPDESVPFENVLNVAMLLFTNYVNAATSMSESCGGGGSTPSNWGKDKDDDERDWARRCAQLANWLCKPIRRHKGHRH